MPDPVPNWLATMRQIDGTKWSQDDGGPNPTIQAWLRFVGATYPNMAAYCNAQLNDPYFSWCGLTVAFCMAKSGIAPVFGASATSQFLYATAWLNWGTSVTTPQPGDVVVFNFGGGDHHVTLFEADNGNGTWSCHGGNQSHEVKLSNYSKSALMGIRRPSAAAAAQPVAAGTLAPGTDGRAVTALQSALASQGFDPGGVDGEFGPLTSAAVSTYQRSRNLPVTGVADATTLQALGVSADSSPQPNAAKEGSTMQLQDILNTLVGALITKQQGTTASTTSPASPAQGPVDVAQLLQTAITALAGPPPATSGSGTKGATTPPVLSTIDQILGGQALAGKKTMIAVIAYVILAILQALGVIGTATGSTATPAGDILTTIITAFGVLGGVAKVDRLTQAVGQGANQGKPPQQ